MGLRALSSAIKSFNDQTGLMTDDNSSDAKMMFLLFGLDFDKVILINKKNIDKYIKLYFSRKLYHVRKQNKKVRDLVSWAG